MVNALIQVMVVIVVTNIKRIMMMRVAELMQIVMPVE